MVKGGEEGQPPIHLLDHATTRHSDVKYEKPQITVFKKRKVYRNRSRNKSKNKT